VPTDCVKAEKGIKEWKEKIKAFQQSGWGVFFCAYADMPHVMHGKQMSFQPIF